ncbi:MFS transporter [Halobacteriales archaeon QS_1_68_20]|nr:MAG: MFS transporter [Halobacteriales archaeon QS_1_68_20]
MDTSVWVAIAGLFLLSTAAAAYEIAPASVAPTIMGDLGIGQARAGWLVSVMYAVAVATSIPVGAALDRTDLLRAVAAAAVALLVAGVWGWVAATRGDYLGLVVSRMLGGLAYVTVWNAGANLAGRAVPPRHQATAVGVFTASAPAGFALGQLGGPLIAGAAGWPAILPAFGVLAVAGIALFWWAVGGRAAGAGEVEPPTRAEFRRVFATRPVWVICGMGFAAFSLYLFLNSWLPAFFEARLGLSLAATGLVVAVFPAVGVVARTGGGVLSDRLFDGRRRPVALASFALSVPVVVALAFVGTVVPALALLVVAGATIQLGIGLLYAYVREVVDPSVRGTAVSLLTSVGLLGALVAPVGAGWLIELTGTYELAFFAAGVVGVGGGALALVAPEPGS